MGCTNCGEKTSTGWDGENLELCSNCSKEVAKKDFNRKQVHEKLVSSEIANTFKFRTIIFILLGLIIPFWPITLPLFWFFAYQSYITGSTERPENGSKVNDISKYDELKKLKELYDSGAITEQEFNLEKQKILVRAS